jgi:hypothetical protein
MEFFQYNMVFDQKCLEGIYNKSLHLNVLSFDISHFDILLT